VGHMTRSLDKRAMLRSIGCLFEEHVCHQDSGFVRPKRGPEALLTVSEFDSLSFILLLSAHMFMGNPSPSSSESKLLEATISIPWKTPGFPPSLAPEDKNSSRLSRCQCRNNNPCLALCRSTVLGHGRRADNTNRCSDSAKCAREPCVDLDTICLLSHGLTGYSWPSTTAAAGNEA